MNAIPDTPRSVVWDITYACPLRCVHCYSESGRRPSRQLSYDDMLRVADAIIEAQPKALALTGGEPLVVKGIFDLARRFTEAGINVHVFTSGWYMKPEMVDELAESVCEVIVSIDGATAEMHDAIRARKGGFDRAMKAMTMLNDGIRARRARGEKTMALGIDVVVIRSNWSHMERFCTDIAPRFSELGVLEFGAVAATGMASRVGFAEHELLTEEQITEISGDALRDRLQAIAPSWVEISCKHNVYFQMTPQQVADGLPFSLVTVEADGDVRAAPLYEGTVGNLLDEPLSVLWKRGIEHWADPFITEALSSVRTMQDWATAVRKIDYRFGTDLVRARIDKRPEFLGPITVPAP